MIRPTAITVTIISCVSCGPAPTPTHELVLCDRSTSATCDDDIVRGMAAEFIESKSVSGSRFEVLATGCGIDDVDRVYQIAVPDRWGNGVAKRKKAWIEAERERLKSLALPGYRRCSGIAAAIWRAARVLTEDSNRERRLTVVSDLREVSRDVGVNFEKRVISPREFVEKLKDANLIADLSKAGVVVCGVHDHGSSDAPHWTAAQSDALRATWRAAFSAMGLSGVTLREVCPMRAGHVANAGVAK